MRAFTNSAGEPIVVSVPEVTFVQAISLSVFALPQHENMFLGLHFFSRSAIGIFIIKASSHESSASEEVGDLPGEQNYTQKILIL